MIATLELWVAARTDPVLAHQIVRVEPVVNSTLVSAIVQLLPEHPAQKELRNIVYTAMDALRGPRCQLCGPRLAACAAAMGARVRAPAPDRNRRAAGSVVGLSRAGRRSEA